MSSTASRKPGVIHRVKARNYAFDSTNRIHGDEIAKKYGFTGGLVPGVGLFAYLAHPVVEHYGRNWLSTGWMSAKFIKPIYDGDEVTAAAIASESSTEIELELRTPVGEISSIGRAGLFRPMLEEPTLAEFPETPAPRPEERSEPKASALPPGKILGSLVHEPPREEVVRKQNENYRETLEIYRGDQALYHPAVLIDLSNNILMLNVALGPWIHTESLLQNCSPAGAGEKLLVRAKVLEAVEKRGHQFATLDVAIFHSSYEPVARVRHTAIIALRED